MGFLEVPMIHRTPFIWEAPGVEFAPCLSLSYKNSIFTTYLNIHLGLELSSAICESKSFMSSYDFSLLAPGVGVGQGSLACCRLWGRRVGHDWATELNTLKNNYITTRKKSFRPKTGGGIQPLRNTEWKISERAPCSNIERG